MKVEISKEELEELYVKQKLSCRKMAILYHSTHGTIVKLLRRNGIKRRSRSEEGKLIKPPIKYKISKEKLRELYWEKKLSPYQIARKYGCSAGCIFNKMKRYGIVLRNLEEGIALSVPRRSRTLADVITKYEKRDFDGSDIDKAYLIGFRLGDLNVRKNKYGKTLFVSSGTTKKAQLDLMDSLFQDCGNISKHRLNTGCIQFNCRLNMSFDFLLPKEDDVPGWILADNKSFNAFFAGYIDAEGHFGVYNGFAEFSITSGDVNILSLASEKLNELGVFCREPRLQVKAGHVDKRGVRWNGSIYRIRITRMNDLLKLINLIKPHVKHAKRFDDLRKAETSIIERNKRV